MRKIFSNLNELMGIASGALSMSAIPFACIDLITTKEAIDAIVLGMIFMAMAYLLEQKLCRN
jgi:uncharacterized membrane protein HdeD (DUF308 family)